MSAKARTRGAFAGPSAEGHLHAGLHILGRAWRAANPARLSALRGLFSCAQQQGLCLAGRDTHTSSLAQLALKTRAESRLPSLGANCVARVGPVRSLLFDPLRLKDVSYTNLPRPSIFPAYLMYVSAAR